MRLSVTNNMLETSLTMFSICIFMLISTLALGQTQKTSVTSGVTFQWSGPQPTQTDSAELISITIDDIVFQSIAAPSSYAMTRVGPDGHDENKITNNGVEINDDSSNIDWEADAIDAFQDKNLNHYFQANPNGRDLCNTFSAIPGTDSQLQSLHYNPGIPSNEGGIIAITERNANNCYYISVYGTPVGGGPEEFLGDTFVRQNSTQTGPQFNAPPAGTDYWNSGRVVENNGTIGIAIFVLKDLAPVGSIITRVDLVAATVDHGDGKFFILQRYAKPIVESGCVNETFYGSVDGRHIPQGSTFSLVGSPVPAGQSFTFNPDGTYEYTPSIGYTGDVVFDYNVCLPAPNTSICDTSDVTLTLVGGPGSGCECNSGAADAPGLNN